MNVPWVVTNNPITTITTAMTRASRDRQTRRSTHRRNATASCQRVVLTGSTRRFTTLPDPAADAVRAGEAAFLARMDLVAGKQHHGEHHQTGPHRRGEFEQRLDDDTDEQELDRGTRRRDYQ